MMSGSQQRQQPPCNVNLELILKMIMEHSPGWIIDKTRKKCIKDAIETKNLAFLRILAQTIEPFIKTSEYLEFAAGVENNFHVIEYLLSLNFPIDQLKVLSSAVEKKAFESLKFLHEKKRFAIDDNYKLFSYAAGIENNIEIMEYLKSHNCPISLFATSNAVAKNDNLNNLKWLLKNGLFLMDSGIFNDAMENGSLDVLEWLSDHGCPIKQRDPLLQLENCSIETIKWLIEKGIQVYPSSVFEGAARNGCLDKMKWMLKKEKYSSKNPRYFPAAAEHGSLENLKWLLKNGCPIDDSYILAAAASQGHFEVMKWLLKNKCPINNSEILVAAAEFGSIEQMKWLFDNNCPIGNDSLNLVDL